MKILVDSNWLRETIPGDPDLAFEVGAAMDAIQDLGIVVSRQPTAEEINKTVELKYAFGVFIRMLRRREELRVSELSERARVEAEEVYNIERDPHYMPRPRTVHNLATYFKIDARRMMKIAGNVTVANENIRSEAVRFAAKSDDISRLSKDEKNMLNEFVRYVNESKDLEADV